MHVRFGEGAPETAGRKTGAARVLYSTVHPHLDVFSRKVVGWAFGQRHTDDLVLSALNMALLTRKPDCVIHHSDSKNVLASSRRSDPHSDGPVRDWCREAFQVA